MLVIIMMAKGEMIVIDLSASSITPYDNAYAYHIRQSLKNQSGNKEQEPMRMMEAYKRSFIQHISETYKELINEDAIARELVERISSSPLI